MAAAVERYVTTELFAATVCAPAPVLRPPVCDAPRGNPRNGQPGPWRASSGAVRNRTHQSGGAVVCVRCTTAGHALALSSALNGSYGVYADVALRGRSHDPWPTPPLRLTYAPDAQQPAAGMAHVAECPAWIEYSEVYDLGKAGGDGGSGVGAGTATSHGTALDSSTASRLLTRAIRASSRRSGVRPRSSQPTRGTWAAVTSDAALGRSGAPDENRDQVMVARHGHVSCRHLGPWTWPSREEVEAQDVAHEQMISALCMQRQQCKLRKRQRAEVKCVPPACIVPFPAVDLGQSLPGQAGCAFLRERYALVARQLALPEDLQRRQREQRLAQEQNRPTSALAARTPGPPEDTG